MSKKRILRAPATGRRSTVPQSPAGVELFAGGSPFQSGTVNRDAAAAYGIHGDNRINGSEAFRPEEGP